METEFEVRVEGNFMTVPLEKCLQEFAQKIRSSIYISYPHGEARDPGGDDFGLYIYLWSKPSRRSMKEMNIPEAYGCVLLDGQDEGTILDSCDEGVGKVIVEPSGYKVALIVGKTIYVLFDLIHNCPGYLSNAEKLLKPILDDYFLYLSNEEEFDKEMKGRLSSDDEKKFVSSYRDLTGRSHSIEGDIASLNAKLGEKKLIISERLSRIKRLQSMPTKEVDESTFEDVYQFLCKFSSTGSISMIHSGICIPVGQIDIEYEGEIYDIGMFDVIIDPMNFRIGCRNNTRVVEGEVFDSYHPHVDVSGECCLGNIAWEIDFLMMEREWEVALMLMLRFLRSYSPENPYNKIESWPVKRKARKNG
ncbi:MAG TPA: hypothetical protein VLH94_00995 [Spirochaetia bacterium]|nr:hypothetical protein [Spirochaetia bacterium]